MSIADMFLGAGRSGAEVKVENKVTGLTETLVTESPPPPSAVSADTTHSTASAEIEFSRSLAYSKISVRLFVSVPCTVGREDAALRTLTDMLNKQAVAYEQKAIERLREWAQG